MTGKAARAGSQPPRWRDIVLPLLRPRPSDPMQGPRGPRHLRFWVFLLALLGAFVALPLLRPDWIAARPQAATPAPPPAAAPASTPAAWPDGARLRDCDDDTLCPWLRVLPVQPFTMGSPDSERGRFDNEGPAHPVALAERFALMETEVTRAQFARFVAASGWVVPQGCEVISADGTTFKNQPGASWLRPGFEQAGDHPVVCVSWNDAVAYAHWLSGQTRQTYRLPTEAEWEYAVRAGSDRRYSFGDDERDLCRHANVADRTARERFPDATIADCTDGLVFTAAVRGRSANRFGLFDLHGNVWEWVADCWHDSYRNAPVDGRSWESNCTDRDRRVVRGGGWVGIPESTRSAFRSDGAADGRSYYTGFRLARTLTSLTLNPLPLAQTAAEAASAVAAPADAAKDAAAAAVQAASK